MLPLRMFSMVEYFEPAAFALSAGSLETEKPYLPIMSERTIPIASLIPRMFVDCVISPSENWLCDLKPLISP